MLALLVATAAMRARAPQLMFNFFGQQPSPADVYRPDPDAKPACLPASYDAIATAAINGVIAARDDGLPAVEVDFPPIASVNARGDGSAKSERLINEANAKFISTLRSALSGNIFIVGCGAGALKANAGAVSLREAKTAVAGCDVVICVSPTASEQWDAVTDLGAKFTVVVNGLIENGRLPHAYFYKPLSAFSVQTGGVVRCYPGAYECYDASGTKLDLEISLMRQGKRALPDTKDAQMRLQNEFGRQGGGSRGGAPRMALYDERDFEGDDMDGPLSTSERWVLFDMPFWFLVLSGVLYASTNLFPNTPVSWAVVFGVIALGGTWEWPRRDDDTAFDWLQFDFEEEEIDD
jgi:hypothetical protein